MQSNSPEVLNQLTDYYKSKEVQGSLNPKKERGQMETQVIRNFVSLRDLINNINESIEECEGLSMIPKVTLETDGYDFYIKFLNEIIWDSDNNGWEPIIEIEKQVREEIRNNLENLNKISV